MWKIIYLNFIIYLVVTAKFHLSEFAACHKSVCIYKVYTEVSLLQQLARHRYTHKKRILIRPSCYVDFNKSVCSTLALFLWAEAVTVQCSITTMEGWWALLKLNEQCQLQFKINLLSVVILYFWFCITVHTEGCEQLGGM